MLGAKQLFIRNRVLAGLPRLDFRKLLRVLEPVDLPFGQVLYESQARIRHVYFPNDCFVSMLTGVDGDRSAEVGLIGSEGMIGLPVALGIAVSPFRAVVQGGGVAMRMKIADFRREFSQSAALKRELFVFAHLLMIQIAQTAACNRFHAVSQRMARWMLMTSDRVNSDEFRITQEFLALMLACGGSASAWQRAACGSASSSATAAAPSPYSTTEASWRLPASAIKQSKTSTPGHKVNGNLPASPVYSIAGTDK